MFLIQAMFLVFRVFPSAYYFRFVPECGMDFYIENAVEIIILPIFKAYKFDTIKNINDMGFVELMICPNASHCNREAALKWILLLPLETKTSASPHLLYLL